MAKGYVRIDNDLFDFMTSGTLTGAELEVMWFLIRYSKGFNRDTARASYGYMAKGMNCSVDKVRRAVKKLISKGYVKIEYQSNGSQAQVFKIAYANLQLSYVQNSTYDMGQIAHKNMGQIAHQDITEDITDKYNTNKDREIDEKTEEIKTYEQMNEEGFDD